MTDRLSNNPVDYIRPLDINKLEGRMMHIPGPKGKNKEFLIVYGHHGMLERWWSLAENFADYGSVTMPDMPGFGGMDSFEKIGIKPSIDAYADYLAAFLKLRFKRKRLTLVGISYGFVVITRMLQKYPELTRKVDLLISESGYMHKDDFVYSRPKRSLYRAGAKVLSTKPVVLLEKLTFVNSLGAKLADGRSSSSNLRHSKMTKEEIDAALDFETRLWQVNDLRTRWLTTKELLKLDNCHLKVNLPVIHVFPKSDPLLNNDYVKEHMLIVFSGYKGYLSRNTPRTLSVIANKKDVGAMLPHALRRQLLKIS